MPKTKFKVGDKVKILQSAINDGVLDKAIGNIGRIVDITGGNNCRVFMDKLKLNNSGYFWVVSLCNVSPVVVVGQQLLLWEWV